MQLQGDRFSKAISKVELTAPDYAHEGINGYLETKVTFEVRDLTEFSKLYSSSYDSDKTMVLYTQLKKVGCQ